MRAVSAPIPERIDVWERSTRQRGMQHYQHRQKEHSFFNASLFFFSTYKNKEKEKEEERGEGGREGEIGRRKRGREEGKRRWEGRKKETFKNISNKFEVLKRENRDAILHCQICEVICLPASSDMWRDHFTDWGQSQQ